jgi:hypothetical protein
MRGFFLVLAFSSFMLSLTDGFVAFPSKSPRISAVPPSLFGATPAETIASSDDSNETSAPFDSDYYTSASNIVNPPSAGRAGRITLQRFLSQFVKDHPEYKQLKNIYVAVQMACKTISHLVNRAGLVLDTRTGDKDDFSDGRFYSMKRLDKLSTTVMKNAMKFTGTVQMVVPEAKMDSEIPEQHQPGVLIAYDKNYLACLDPMDGSGTCIFLFK